MFAIVAAIALLAVSAFASGVAVTERRRNQEQVEAIGRLWSLQKELREENQVLVESLTRSEGRVFVRPPSQRKDSPGWYDRKPAPPPETEANN